MQLVAGRYVSSISDLTDDLECGHLTWLEARVAAGELRRPPVEDAERLIAAKGREHERVQLDLLQAEFGAGLEIFEPEPLTTIAAMEAAEAATLAAMARGVRVIAQATFFDGTFVGRADFLRRVEQPSGRWDWSYEVVDTKLALTPKPHYLLQLCGYSEHVARLQGSPPEHAHVVLGSGRERRFRVDDYAAYFRRRKAVFLDHLAQLTDAYPRERAHCAMCRWQPACEERREADDDLGLVARIRADQIDRLKAAGITTVAALAAAGDGDRPKGVAVESFAILREQASLQDRSRRATASGAEGANNFYTLLACGEKSGFHLLPEPDEGDMFFDMEGDPLYAPGRGLEYLFGAYLPAEDSYVPFWAKSDAEEQDAFERFVDLVKERRARYPRMHVYHYAPYEVSALKRLMGRFGSREKEIDELLESLVFVDLYAVVRQSLQISQPSYSIKKLEPFYGMKRDTNVVRGDDSIVQFEAWLATGDDAILEDIERYNRDDCKSTYLLREWLLARRIEHLPACTFEGCWRPDADPRAVTLDPDADAIAAELLNGLPPIADAAALLREPDGVRVRWLLGHFLQFHRREAKPAWWEYFHRIDNADELEELDGESMGGLVLRDDIAPYKLTPKQRNLVFTYTFPQQAHKMSPGDRPHCPHRQKEAGEIVSIDLEKRLIEIKLAGQQTAADLRALIPGPGPRDSTQRVALRELARAYLGGTLDGVSPAALDILLARAPRLRDRPAGAPLQPESVTAEALGTIVRNLDSSYLFIQGPPGSGKTTKGANFIVDLIAERKKIAILARGHKAVHNLLGKIEEIALERGVTFSGLYKGSAENEDSQYVSRRNLTAFRNTTSYDDFDNADHDIAGGTAWLFSRESRAGQYDYLIVDEAGQLALADVIACAASARNVILLGDPLQLPQVSQGSHPPGTDASVLEHLLGEATTVPVDRGIFLDVSFRMHPEICEFISRTVYESRLKSWPGTAGNAIVSPGLSGGGLRSIPVEHYGNRRASVQEAERIVAESAALLAGTASIDGITRPMKPDDILVVTPYNAQVAMLREKLDAAGLEGVRAGTVDKFQGQEAPVVFYSMATSSGDDLPRDMEFLFEKNRLNVALSRAQALTVLVYSPRLLDVNCSHVGQVALASLLCRFVEDSTPVLEVPAPALT